MKNEGYIFVLCLTGVLILACVMGRPSFLSDDNKFLREFVDSDLLSFLGVVLTLSIGLLAQLFLSVEKLTDRLGRDAISSIRSELRSTARTLLIIFAITMALVFIKPILPQVDVHLAILNGLVVFLVVFYLCILSDVILSVFDFDI
ncbi:hypothetical protein [Sulfitobacter sp. D7]|jgi:hypothetical protein|uniref:hypothetical protein n=1 Tax=Sulfitobacter sp. D7 TaxID=1968541 RepID=UPI000E778B1A|nr:hypothetical protein [Sulfitobacter sp. D7]AYE86836.1 hypothetical protein B5M07_12365 [Sulfitobacter sp. D7]